MLFIDIESADCNYDDLAVNEDDKETWYGWTPGEEPKSEDGAI